MLKDKKVIWWIYPCAGVHQTWCGPFRRLARTTNPVRGCPIFFSSLQDYLSLWWSLCGVSPLRGGPSFTLFLAISFSSDLSVTWPPHLLTVHSEEHYHFSAMSLCKFFGAAGATYALGILVSWKLWKRSVYLVCLCYWACNSWEVN